jgi:hypothetical protein
MRGENGIGLSESGSTTYLRKLGARVRAKRASVIGLFTESNIFFLMNRQTEFKSNVKCLNKLDFSPTLS